MNKFSELKRGNYFYKLLLNDNIGYKGNFEKFVDKEIDIKISKIKVHQIIYPGIVKTGPYYCMTPNGNKATYGEKEANEYVNIIYQDDGRLLKLTLENKESSTNHSIDNINLFNETFFVSKQALDEYVLDYCNKYIHQYDMQIKDLEIKREKYQQFIDAYRS